ncbi:MAG TPA: mucoidy inhibitor MuiA family protein [Chroococcales cyanobacterium]
MANPELPDRNMRQTIDTQITEVTVYSDRARVTRRGKGTLTGQEQELAIAGLPMTLQTESVRATGAGTVAVRLLGVRTEKVFSTEPVAERVAQLARAIQQLKKRKRIIQNQLASRQLPRRFIQILTEKSVQYFSRSLSQKTVGLHETDEFLNFLERRYRADIDAIAQYQEQQQKLDRELEVLQQQLEQVKHPRPKESWSIIVTVATAVAGDLDLDVSYVVDRASWTPLYDLHTSSSGDRLTLSYLAQVKQTTGEDWLGAALTLSTAKPGLGTLPPKLEPWYIEVPRPLLSPSALPAPASALSRSEAKKRQLAASQEDDVIDMNDITMIAEPIALETVAAAVSKEGGVITFQLDGNSNIPSDGAPHKVTIFSDDYPSRPEYIAIPKLVSFAYLQAAVTNPSTGATLLPGKANIFRENTFVGTTELENISPGQEFKLNLGIDEGLKIQRDLVERQVDKKLIGNQCRTTYAYRLAIANLQDVPTSLTLKEQLPVSRDEKIKVRLTQTNPKIQLGEMGLLEWKIDLPAQHKREISYQFVIEHPPDYSIG